MRSLRSRLMLVATIWAVLGVASAGIALSLVFQDFLGRQLNDELLEHLDELEVLLETGPDGTLKLVRPLSDPRYQPPHSGFYWQVQDNRGVIARSGSLKGDTLSISELPRADGETHTLMIDGPTGKLHIAERARMLDTPASPVHFIIGTDEAHLRQELQQFNNVLLWSLGGFAASMISAAVLLLFYAMTPFSQLREGLAAVRSGSAASMKGKFPEEVQPLIDDLNGLLQSSSEQIGRARAQAGNIAHGLKTPLAILVDEAEQLNRRGETETASVIRDQCRRMQSHIDYQIARARIAATRARPGTLSSLSDVATAVTAALSRLYVDRGVVIRNDIPDRVMVAAEREDLNELLANIVDNALRHARSVVRLGIDGDYSRQLKFVVEDDGPGLPPEAWKIVFNIGTQWESDNQGSGLGLAIVRDLAQLYGGDVELGRSDLGGLKVTIQLPVPDRGAFLVKK